MRDYEVVYIFQSALEDEEVESKLDAFHERLTESGAGEITAVEDWGKRQLAYPIENQENGRYVVAQFSAEPEVLDDFERSLKLDGDLLRHLVVLHEGELPAPPSARRPGAGTDEEDEEEPAEDEEEPGEDEEEPAEEEEEPAEAEEESADGDEESTESESGADSGESDAGDGEDGEPAAEEAEEGSGEEPDADDEVEPDEGEASGDEDEASADEDERAADEDEEKE